MNTTVEWAVDSEVVARLRIAVGRLARALRPTETSLAAELTPTRVVVLLSVVRNGKVRLAEVAAQEGLNPTLLSRTVAHLTQEGLITRTADPTDRRSAWLEPTPAGCQLADRIRAERTETLRAAILGLQPEDGALIESALPALERLAELLHQERP
jgi:DNA-binding MarR family transcriptional regulator